MEILLTLVLLAPLVWLLERTHRRTRDLPRMPFGVDAESEAADAYRRQLAELRELTDSALAKLRDITDAEYAALDLTPDFDL